jgi:NodT family efflux transporter outer membrane factor (OMF) lipoprotein
LVNAVLQLSRLLYRLGVGVAAFLAGCVLGPNYQRPVAPVPAFYKELPPPPAGWKSAAPFDDADRGKWWSIFHDPLLDQLEAEVDIQNQNLKAYEAAYRQALAATAKSRSELFPTLDAGGEAGVGHFVGSGTSKSKAGGVSVGWDLDLWGKVRRQIESDNAAAQASAAELASVRLSAQATLATDYFELRYQDSLARLLADTVGAYQRILAIARSKYSAGSAALSDVVSAETQSNIAQAQLIAARASRSQYEHAIALLTGQPPAALSVPVADLTVAIPDIPIIVPSALLERRPDVAQAERLMQRQNALIGVALGAYYPAISLSGLIADVDAGGLISLSNPVWSLGASGSALLLDGGGRSASVAAARAAYDQSVASYRQSVLTAFHDVEDALSDLYVLAQQSDAQSQAVISSHRAVEFTLREYRAGAQDYTTVANAQLAALSAKETELQIQKNRLTQSVALLEALGGGWESQY